MSESRSNYTPRPMSSKTTYALGAVALALIAVIVVAAINWGHDEASVRNDGYGPVRDASVRAQLEPDGSILLGRVDAKKTIDIFEDPLCPGCGNLERIYGQEIAQKIDEGTLAVRYRLVNFLDARSRSKDYSSRAVAANQCVAEGGSGPVYSKFHMELFTTKRPSEGGADLSNDELAALARVSGAPESQLQCIATGARVDEAKVTATAATAALGEALDGTAATPAVFDGKTKIDVSNEDWVDVLTR
ncbi:DsbA family protein [Nocardia brasiliensis]|uniref:Putative transmembrane serine/threonine-protein kinase E n=1 Tax=Nocardia brasiliensis (strain ATCC 700358 / HUJEG-1) TaxID=1133849 RepID=K0F4X2_NOCB7|nr:thioredoxin domain-containing protein [Nocardia brasiliensis]AFU04712.1 putative transmembrane serine/threonine-protein kinase E [Nocardia brasiliensis ATCC 700358]OCF88467.1 serine/threonine protein kinase [Nocardia brasiliensis]